MRHLDPFLLPPDRWPAVHSPQPPFLAAGLDIKGVWHLHPPGVTALSCGDIVYAARLFRNPKHAGLDSFAMPITADGHVHGFLVAREGDALRVRCARLVLF